MAKMKADGASASTIKTDLSAIRFVYDQAGGKHKLPENQDLDLERRQFGGTWRAWTPEEYQDAVKLARQQGAQRVEWALGLARHIGLRVHEITRLDHAQLSRAL